MNSKTNFELQVFECWAHSPLFFLGVPHLATFIFDIFVYVIASIAYIHPVYWAGVQTHDLLIMSRLP